MTKWTFQVVPGFFAQDDQAADPTTIGAVPPRLGLLDNSPQRWARFKSRIDELNTAADPGTIYKVLFIARHGQGVHNVVEAKYGTIAWEHVYAKLYGDGELVWGPDPELTALGETQVQELNRLWKAEMTAGIPVPQKGYCSPLTRAMRTAIGSLEGVMRESVIVVVENCREINGVHTCDKRRTKSYIRATFPQLTIEPGLTEEDELWDPEIRETSESVDNRARVVLEGIFQNDSEIYISITAHGDFIRGLMANMGREYTLPTGGIYPVVVKGTAGSVSN